VIRIGEAPAGRRRIQRDGETAVARRGDRGLGPQSSGNCPGQVVGAAMATQQGHHDRAAFGHGNHRRLALLVGDDRRQSPDQAARGAEPDDRAPFQEEGLKLRREVVEVEIRALDPATLADHQDRGQDRLQTRGQVRRAGSQHDEGGRQGAHVQASPRRWMRIMEK